MSGDSIDGSPPGDIGEPEHFCGTCHDVTNPLVITQTPGADRQFMQQHAPDIEIIDAPVTVSAGQQLTVNVNNQ